MQEKQPIAPINFNEGSINIREEIEKYLYYWKWFVLSMVVAFFIAKAYLRYTPNQYSAATTILIGDAGNNELLAFKDLGLVGNSNNSLENEIELLKSRSLFERVVKDLGINVQFFKKGRVYDSESFVKNAPYKLNFLFENTKLYNLSASFSIVSKSDTNFVLVDGINSTEYAFGENVKTSFGELIITPNYNGKLPIGEEIIVIISPVIAVASNYKNRIQIQVVNNSSVLKLSLNDRVKPKAQAILDYLVAQYNREVVEDKNLVAKNTNSFIQERIAEIKEDLAFVESGAENYKTQNRLTDITSEADLALQSKTILEKSIIEVSTQLKLVDFVSEYMKKNKEELFLQI